ncbi:MAG: helix-turn-helix transcriptional regulator [Ktedonobacterales bacterium]|nr:helix-turn-helix transcriptional regulator [Ktedonobacterales bacterium]
MDNEGGKSTVGSRARLGPENTSHKRLTVGRSQLRRIALRQKTSPTFHVPQARFPQADDGPPETLYHYYISQLFACGPTLFGTTLSIEQTISERINYISHSTACYVPSRMFTPTMAPLSQMEYDISLPVKWGGVHYGTLHISVSHTVAERPPLSVDAMKQFAQNIGWFIRTLEDARHIQLTRLEIPSDTLHRIESLSARHQQVLQYMMKGCTSATIAASLCISKRTVESHQREIYERLQVKRREDAVLVGLAAGLASWPLAQKADDAEELASTVKRQASR